MIVYDIKTLRDEAFFLDKLILVVPSYKYRNSHYEDKTV